MLARWLVFTVLLWGLNTSEKGDLGRGSGEKKGESDIAALPERRGEGGGCFCAAATTKPLVHGVDRNGLSKNGKGCSILSKCIPTSVFEDSDSKFLFIKLSGVLNADALEQESISIALKE